MGTRLGRCPLHIDPLRREGQKKKYLANLFGKYTPQGSGCQACLLAGRYTNTLLPARATLRVQRPAATSASIQR